MQTDQKIFISIDRGSETQAEAVAQARAKLGASGIIFLIDAVGVYDSVDADTILHVTDEDAQ